MPPYIAVLICKHTNVQTDDDDNDNNDNDNDDNDDDDDDEENDNQYLPSAVFLAQGASGAEH